MKTAQQQIRILITDYRSQKKAASFAYRSQKKAASFAYRFQKKAASFAYRFQKKAASFAYRLQNFHSEIRNPKSGFRALSAGFTLVEILVAITILATLIGGVLLTLNPIRQINKSLDAKRQQDLQSVKVAVDTYYHDKKCYPAQIPFGKEWSENNTVYMKMVPQDTKCGNGGSDASCYNYRTDTSSTCPQWNVLFAKLSSDSSLTNACPLSSLSSCAPSGYSDGVWACTLSGAVDCSLLASSATLTGGLETVLPTNTPTPGPTATPTPVPAPPAGSVTYNIGAPANTNPYPYQATIMPLYQTIGNTQSIEVLANDTVGNITSMKVVLYSDGDARQFTLTRVAGTANNGTWGGQSQPWQVTDTYDRFYGYEIIATDDQNNTYTARIPVRNEGL